MKPANYPRFARESAKLLLINQNRNPEHAVLSDLDQQFQAGDLLVVNRSATVPASLRARIVRSGEELEIRLAAFQGSSLKRLDRWQAIVFGAGDWRQPTEERGLVPKLMVGDQLEFGPSLQAKVQTIRFDRLVTLEFAGDNIAGDLYRYGKPIQYSYHQRELRVWEQQTIFAGPPVSVEPPSASLQLTWNLLLKLKQRGVEIRTLIHSAGISSSGDQNIDACMPFAEYSDVPEATLAAIERVRREGGRVIALGTTVVRALEARAESSIAGPKLVTLKISPEHQFKMVDGLITGMHEPESSHLQILNAFCPVQKIRQGYREASEREYLGHEYGDLTLLNCGC